MKPIRLTSLPWREVEGRVVILSPKTASIHELNLVASFLWVSADGTKTQKSISHELAMNFEVDQENAEKDTADFFLQMHSLKLIQWESEKNVDSR